MAPSIFRLRKKSTPNKTDEAESHRTQVSAPDSLDSVRPKLLLDSIYLPAEKGVYFRSRQGIFTLDGKDNYSLLMELVPRLTGEQTTSELCAGVGPDKSEAARKLISTLLEKRIVINHVEERIEIAPPILEKFAPQITFIEHFTDTPIARFAKFRRSRILLTGAGIPLKVLALSLARNGLETITLDTTAPSIERDQEFRSLVDSFHGVGIPIRTERVRLTDVVTKKSDPFDAICYVSDIADLHTMVSLNEYACSNPISFLPGLLLSGKAFVGPLVRNSQAGCWMCALLRHSANVPPQLEAQIWRHLSLAIPWDNDRQPVSAPALRILGNMLGFEMFKFFIGHLPAETDSAVLSLDLETLETARSQLLPHPDCPHCSRIQPQSDRDRLSKANANVPAERLDVARKLTLVSPLFGPDFGIIRRFDDDDLVQIPLFQSAAILARRTGVNEMAVPGFAIQNNATARLDAVMSAMRAYVATVPDRRRFWTGSRNEAARTGLNPVPEVALAGWMGGPGMSADQTTNWMFARSFGLGTIHVVNAGAVYPCTPVNPGGFEQVEPGVGLGFTFRQACGNAILSVFTHEVLKRAATNEATFFEISSESFADGNRDFVYLRNVLGHMDRPFRLLGFTHEGSGSVVLAFSPRDASDISRIGVGTAAKLEAAAVSALTDFVAIALGRPSVRTVADYLPAPLGYAFHGDCLAISEREIRVNPSSGDQRMNSVLYAFNGTFTDVMIANLTDEDLRRGNLVAVKALFVRSDYPS